MRMMFYFEVGELWGFCLNSLQINEWGKMSTNKNPYIVFFMSSFLKELNDSASVKSSALTPSVKCHESTSDVNWLYIHKIELNYALPAPWYKIKTQNNQD